jgi:hypothetical protein
MRMLNRLTPRKSFWFAAIGNFKEELCILSKKLIFGATAALLLMPCALFAQTMTPLTNQPPDGVALTFLLTDGTVLAQDWINPAFWWRLTPDINGSYVNGTWTQVASLPLTYAPYASSSAVLADGRLILVGGEYTTPNFNFTLTNQGAIYDPVANTWTPVEPPPGWNYIGDSPAVVLPNGKLLLGNKLTKQMSVLDPHTMRWTNVDSDEKADFNAEEGWTLLPNGTILTADVKDAPNSEIYQPSEEEWDSAGSTIVDLHSPSPFGCQPYGPGGSLCYYPPGEIGPAILRPDGTVFATGSYTDNNPGSPGNTAIYDTHTRTWKVGPIFPNGDNAGDSFAVLLPNGNVLVEGVNVTQGGGPGYEFDGINLTLTTSPSTYLGSLTVLPDGEVLAGGLPEVYYGSTYPTQTYTSTTGTYEASWAPRITLIETDFLRRGRTYRVWGARFNGMSQAQAYGDEFQGATNYPLVRITNKRTHHVFYARTHDHSTMGVATGDKLVWTNFDVPATMETGESTLVVVANGIPSKAVTVFVH